MSKLLSAFVNDHFAISEEAVHRYLPIAQSIYNGTYQPAAEDLPDDDLIPDEADDDDDQLPQQDTYTGKIAVMSITGVLMHYGGMCSYGAVDYANRIDAYRTDPDISGLIIKADGPGGQVQGTKTLHDAVANFRAQKPLLVMVDDGIMASAHVWALLSATEVYCSNTICRVGSVGVMACFLDVRKAMEMNGLKEILIYAPQSTDKNKDYTDALDGKPAALQAELKFLCETFITEVANNRQGKLTSTEWNTGKMFFAEEAARIGLIDGVKNYTEVVARMQELIALNQKSNNMSLLGTNKLPKTAALKGIAAITAEQLDPVNAEITEFGIAGVTMALDSELAVLQASHDKLPTVEAALTAAEGREATLITEVAALKAKLSTKPGAAVTAPAATETDEIPGTGEVDAFLTDVDREAKANQW